MKMFVGFSLEDPLTDQQETLLELWHRNCLMLNLLEAQPDLSRRPLYLDLDTRREAEIRKVELDRLRVINAALEDEMVAIERNKPRQAA